MLCFESKLVAIGLGGSYKNPKPKPVNKKPKTEKPVLYIYQIEASSLVFLKNFQTELVVSE